MSELSIKFGTPTTFAITVNNFTSLSRTFSDITDVVFMAKNKATDADNASVLFKQFKGTTGQITLDSATKTIIVNVKKEDFYSKKLATNGNYLLAIGVEFNNSKVYIEDKDDKFDRRLKITPDKIRM